MIEFKVKTLDGQDHIFNVDENITLREFRAHLEDKTQIAANRQRLIFKGRVLTNDGETLGTLGVADKVLHVVERSATATNRARNAGNGNGAAGRRTNETQHMFQQAAAGIPQFLNRNMTQTQIEGLIRQALDRLGDVGRNARVTSTRRGNMLDVRIVFTPSAPSQMNSPARSRIHHIRRVFSHIHHICWHLERESLEGLLPANAEAASPTVDNTGELSTDNPPPHENDQVDLGFSPLVGECNDRSHEIPPGEETSTASTTTTAGSSDIDGSPPPLLVNRNDASVTTAAATGEEEVVGVGATTGDNTTGGADQEQPAAPSQERIRIHHSMATVMSGLYGQLIAVQRRMEPQIERFRQLVGADRDYSDDVGQRKLIELGRRAARFFNAVQVCMHDVAHASHALSDLTMHFCEPPPRRLYPQYTRTDVPPMHGEAEVAITIGQSDAEVLQAANQAAAAVMQQQQPQQQQQQQPQQQPPSTTSSTTTTTRTLVHATAANAEGEVQGGITIEMDDNGQFVMQNDGNLPANISQMIQNSIATQAMQAMQAAHQQRHQQQVQQAHMQAHAQAVRHNHPQQARMPPPPSIPPAPPGPNNVPGAPMPPFRMAHGPIRGPFPPPIRPGQRMFGPRQAHAHFRGRMAIPVPARFASPNAGGFGRGGGHHHHHHHPPTGVAGGPTLQPNAGQQTEAARRGRQQQGLPLAAININEENMDSVIEQALFLGYRPPSELPLFTLDPFLPCSSRHFDPRQLRRLRDTRARGIYADRAPEAEAGTTQASTAETTEGSNTTTTTTTTVEEQATSTTAANTSAEENVSYENDEPGNVADADADFVDGLERMLRSAVLNLYDEPGEEQNDNQEQRLYAFHQLTPTQAQQPAQVIHGTLHLQQQPGAPPAAAGGGGAGAGGAGAQQPGINLGQLGPALMRSLPPQLQSVAESVVNNPNQSMESLMARMQQQGIAPSDDFPGTFSELFPLLTNNLTMVDISSMLFGSGASVLERNRQTIRSQVISAIMNDNSRPSQDDIRAAAHRIAVTPEQLATRFGAREEQLPFVGTVNGRSVNLLATMSNVDERFAREVLQAVLDPEPANFGARVWQAGVSNVRRMWALLDTRVDNAPEINMFASLTSSQGDNDQQMLTAVTPMMIQLTRSVVFGSSTAEAVLRQIESDLVLPGAAGHRGLIDDMDVDDGPNVTVTNPPAPITATATAVQPQQPITTARNEPEVKKPSDAPKTPKSVTNDSSDKTTRRPNKEASPAGDQAWKRTLPPDWVRVIEEDLELQRVMDTQPPLSDAYLTGMPVKRRKTILEERTQALDVSKVLGSAIDRASVNSVTGESNADIVSSCTATNSLASAHSRDLQTRITDRLRSDADVRPDKMPNSTKMCENGDAL